jgi:hypothetical protein
MFIEHIAVYDSRENHELVLELVLELVFYLRTRDKLIMIALVELLLLLAISWVQSLIQSVGANSAF